MGGCRCTYKNCTLRTDGVTHMFHYPVFDKVRCHQWLTNAQKLEFLNLKVSQLKNRVVCQHHFKDDNFMNFLKDKLTFDAVPTEDGPYCDSSQIKNKKPEQDESKLYTISLEDIENEYLTFNDKKANFSVKYGDFLTNCDLMDLDSLNLTNHTQIVSKDKGLYQSLDYEEPSDLKLNNNIDQKPINPVLNKSLNTLPPNTDSVYTIHMTEVPIEIDTVNATNIMHPYVPANLPQNTQQYDTKVFTHKLKELPKKKNGKSLLKETKITILDEQKISETVPIPSKLEPVCPTSVLPLPKRKTNQNFNQTRPDNIYVLNNKTEVVAPTVVEQNNIEPVINIAKQLDNVNVIHNTEMLDNLIKIENPRREKIVKDVTHTSSVKTRSSVLKAVNVKRSNNNSLLKNKIPPERVAAIEEKRKFNMKLRDIIASCLDKLDDEDQRGRNNTKLKSRIEKNITQKVGSYLSEEPDLPVQDYAVAYLEAKMKKMENILLHKIDQNTQRILEVKQLLSSSNRSVCTQTVISEEQTKKQLYQEISKYLTPQTSSSIYEELFINKFVPKRPQSSTPKKRKYR